MIWRWRSSNGFPERSTIVASPPGLTKEGFRHATNRFAHVVARWRLASGRRAASHDSAGRMAGVDWTPACVTWNAADLRPVAGVADALGHPRHRLARVRADSWGGVLRRHERGGGHADAAVC